MEEDSKSLDPVSGDESLRAKTEAPLSETISEDIEAENADKVYFEWDGLEYIKQEKGFKWFAVAILVSLLVLAYVLYTRDWFMILVILATDVLFFFYLRRKPLSRHYRLTKMGLFMDELFYPFDEMHSFWIVYNNKVKMLNLVFLKKYIPVFSLYLNELDPLKVRSFLKNMLPEQEKKGELFVDKLLRILKI